MRPMTGETMRARRQWQKKVALAAVLSAVLPASRALAWRPFATPQGDWVLWTGAMPGIRLAPGWPAIGDDAALRLVVERAAAPWNAIPCAQPRFEVAGFDARAVADAEDGWTSIFFYDDVEAWNNRFSRLELARTLVSYRVSSGAMVDTDIAVNMAGYLYGFGVECDAENYDFQSMLTHELGHALGLDHSGEEAATMFQRTDPGTCALRDLDPDDTTGICAMYPVPPPPEPGPEPMPEPEPEPLPEVAVEPAVADGVGGRHEPDGCAGGAASGAGLLGALVILAARRRGRVSLARGLRAIG